MLTFSVHTKPTLFKICVKKRKIKFGFKPFMRYVSVRQINNEQKCI